MQTYLGTVGARESGYPHNKLCNQLCLWLLCVGLLGQFKTQLRWFQMSHAICLSRLVSYLGKEILEILIACKIISYRMIILMVACWFVITLLSIDNFNLFIVRSK